MNQRLADLADRLLSAAKAAGADAADTLVVDGTSLSVEVRAGALEQAERSEGIDLGLRVLLGQKQACVSVSDTSDASITTMAERAVAMAREAPDDPYCGLAAAEEVATDWDIAALDMADGTDPEPAALEAAAKEAEAAALAVDGVAQTQGAGASYGRSNRVLATSNGFIGGYERSSHGLQCVAISGEGLGMERDYAGEGRAYASDLPSAQEIGQLAGERAAARAGATRPPTGAYPVLFDERISSSLVGHLVGAINGASITRGASFLKDAMGEAVLPKGMSLVEDPFRPRVSGSKPFDAEGLPVARRALVEDGVLQGWILDLASARKLGMSSTGNAARSVSSPPSPSVGNLELTQGLATREELIAQMGTGLIVTSMIGSTINPNTGDYSRGAAGLWVENGEITGPVNECTIAGNLRDMLLSAIPANDARTYLSRVVPSLLFEGLTIAGT